MNYEFDNKYCKENMKTEKIEAEEMVALAIKIINKIISLESMPIASDDNVIDINALFGKDTGVQSQEKQLVKKLPAKKKDKIINEKI